MHHHHPRSAGPQLLHCGDRSLLEQRRLLLDQLRHSERHLRLLSSWCVVLRHRLAGLELLFRALRPGWHMLLHSQWEFVRPRYSVLFRGLRRRHMCVTRTVLWSAERAAVLQSD
jgi:hypothetical protein